MGDAHVEPPTRVLGLQLQGPVWARCVYACTCKMGGWIIRPRVGWLQGVRKGAGQQQQGLKEEQEIEVSDARAWTARTVGRQGAPPRSAGCWRAWRPAFGFVVKE